MKLPRAGAVLRANASGAALRGKRPDPPSVTAEPEALPFKHCNGRRQHLAFYLFERKHFDRFILVMILTNCVFLALYDPNWEDRSV